MYRKLKLELQLKFHQIYLSVSREKLAERKLLMKNKII